MTLWQWYWVVIGLFAWGVFGMVVFMALWCRMSEKYSEIHGHVMAVMILLAGPFMWIFMLISALAELRRWWKDR